MWLYPPHQHTAGPFQRKEQCAVLEAAVAAGVPYMDVCDDMDYSQRAKRLHKARWRNVCVPADMMCGPVDTSTCRTISTVHPQKAEAAGVPAITTAGIYPGISNLMAAHMVSIARREYNDDFSYRQPYVHAA